MNAVVRTAVNEHPWAKKDKVYLKMYIDSRLFSQMQFLLRSTEIAVARVGEGKTKGTKEKQQKTFFHVSPLVLNYQMSSQRVGRCDLYKMEHPLTATVTSRVAPETFHVGSEGCPEAGFSLLYCRNSLKEGEGPHHSLWDCKAIGVEGVGWVRRKDLLVVLLPSHLRFRINL